MATRLACVVFDAADPSALGRFWSAALGWPVTHEAPDEVVLEPAGGAGPSRPGLPLLLVPVPDPKVGQNRLHLDLATRSTEHQREEVARLVGLGAMPVDIGQGDVPWEVLADPEGNEVCVLDPRPEYAGTGPVAAVVMAAADPEGLARFWAEATGWTLSVDEGRPPALRAPDGRGPFLEFLGGAGAEPNRGKNRLHLDVSPFVGDDQAAEVERLVALGARRVDIGQGEVSWVVLADPEGNELCVLTPR